jgi:carbamoyltransferase
MYLGISAFFHDSSVALIDDNGNLIDYKKEEWFSRVKGDKSFPRLALGDLLLASNVSDTDIKMVTFYEKPFRSWLTVVKQSFSKGGKPTNLTRNYFKNFWQSSISAKYHLSRILPNASMEYCDHHLSHTLTALFYEKNENFVSIVIDGFGDMDCSSIHIGNGSQEIKKLWSSPYPNSVGLFYSSVTDFLGFDINEGEFQVMGLAAYGKPVFAEKLREMIRFENKQLKLTPKYFDFLSETDQSYSSLFEDMLELKGRKNGEPLDLDDENFQVYADLAASCQLITEEILIKIFELAHKLSGKKEFLLSGGVALNCSAVSKLAKLDFVDKISIPPSPGDAGAAIGAAFFGYLRQNQSTGSVKKIGWNQDLGESDALFPAKYAGDNVFLDAALNKLAERSDAFNKAAKLIKDGKIIATCYGNAETGPRALGHRSLICNAHNFDAVKFMSEKIKDRSKFRPTAPAILSKNVNKYFFTEPSLMKPYDQMASVAYPKKNRKDSIDAVIHFDGSSRIQICNEKQTLGRLLSELEEYEIEVIANTSFNVAGDPMVFDNEDAICSMMRMDITYLLTETGLYELK